MVALVLYEFVDDAVVVKKEVVVAAVPFRVINDDDADRIKPFVKRVRFEKVLKSESSVDDAAVPADPVIVMGDVPMIVNCEHETVPLHDPVLVATEKRDAGVPFVVPHAAS